MALVQKYTNAVKSVSSTDDQREDLKLMLEPYMNWEQFLVPAPMCVSLMGNLLLISTGNDFSMEESWPEKGFGDGGLAYPNSFRACLVQVSHAGWDAFNKAHSNMDQIRLYTAQIPGHFKQACEILIKGTAMDVEQTLHIPMNAIQEATMECRGLAEGQQKTFLRVIDLVQQLIQVCTSAQKTQDDKLKDVDIKKAIAEEETEAEKEAKERNQKMLNQLEKSVVEAEKDYKDALNSMPDGTEVLGYALADTVMQTTKSVLNFVTLGLFSIGKNTSADKQEAANKDVQQTSTAIPQTSEAERYVFTKAEFIRSNVNELQSSLEALSASGKKEKEVSKDIQRAETWLRKIEKDIKKMGESESKRQALGIISSATEIAREVLQMHNSGKPLDTAKLKTLNDQAMPLVEAATQLAAKAAFALGANPLAGSTPMVSVCRQKANANLLSDENEDSVAGSITKSAHFKVEHMSSHLKRLQDLHEKTADRLTESNRNLGKLLGEMKKLDFQKVDIESIMKMLREGLRALGQLKKQWSELVRFFDMMANLLKCVMDVSVNKFLEQAKAGEKSRVEGYSISDLVRDQMYNQAFLSISIGHYIHFLSSNYVSVSGKHIMPQISQLDELLAFRKGEDDSKIQLAKAELFSGCEDAKEDIERMIKRNKVNYNSNAAKRDSQIRKELTAAMPKQTVQIEEMTKKAVEAGAEEGQKHCLPLTKQDLADVGEFL